MALFVRPAVWTYDLALFRQATDDEERLESMLAAIARADQGLWVVESNEQPVAFAWTQVEHDTVRAIQLHIGGGEDAIKPLRLLIARIEQEHRRKASRLEVATESLSGAAADAIGDVGLSLDSEVWTKRLAGDD